jgi:hypothetical protein
MATKWLQIGQLARLQFPKLQLFEIGQKCASGHGLPTELKVQHPMVVK